jgi:ferredoxin
MGINHSHLYTLGKTPLFIQLKRAFEAYTYKLLLRFYLAGTWFIKIPILGKRLKRWIEWYGATQHGGKVISKEEAYFWIEKANSILCSFCYCRDTFKHCSTPLGVCLRISDVELFQSADGKRARFVSIQKAKEIIDNSEKIGLIHLIAWCSYPQVYAICNCCKCCCIAYQIWNKYRIESALQKGDMIANRDESICTDCGRCVKRCRFDALHKLPNSEVEFNPDKCFGCGLCRQICENNAIRLVNR